VRLRIKIAGLAMLVLLSFITEGLADNSFSPPTATEAFHPRSECAALGETNWGMLAGGQIREEKWGWYTIRFTRRGRWQTLGGTMLTNT
jgi:hypothetical protein